MLINLNPEYLSKSEVWAFLGEYLCVHNYWATLSVQNNYAEK